MKIKIIMCMISSSLMLFGCSSNDISSNYSQKDSESNSIAFSKDDLSHIENEVTHIKVIYFSCTNTTKNVAIKISSYLNCDIDEIVPEIPYTSEDLNYNNNSSRANTEQNSDNARPAINNTINLEDYNTIFLGYPIWWGKLPKIIYTFCDIYNLDGYTIIPFCTSGSSGISTSVNELKTLEINATILDGKRFSSNASDNEIKTYIDSLDL